jgi:hypothetical protein
MAPENTLTGLWQGQFSYPRAMPPEFFTANLIEAPDFIGGSIQETARSGKHAGKVFYASVHGSRDGNMVRFTKTYETPPMLHEVLYQGTINAEGTEIDGTWTLPGSWSGRFLMIRSTGLAQLAERRETVEV